MSSGDFLYSTFIILDVYLYADFGDTKGEERLINMTEKRRKYTKYEEARIISARALQIAMGAPVLIDTEKIEPIDIAIEEFRRGVIPIMVRRSSDSDSGR